MAVTTISNRAYMRGPVRQHVLDKCVNVIDKKRNVSSTGTTGGTEYVITLKRVRRKQ